MGFNNDGVDVIIKRIEQNLSQRKSSCTARDKYWKRQGTHTIMKLMKITIYCLRKSLATSRLYYNKYKFPNTEILRELHKDSTSKPLLASLRKRQPELAKAIQIYSRTFTS